MDDDQKPDPPRRRSMLGMRSLIPFLALASMPRDDTGRRRGREPHLVESDERAARGPAESDEERRRREARYEAERRQQLASNAQFQAAEERRRKKGAALLRGQQKKPRAERP